MSDLTDQLDIAMAAIAKARALAVPVVTPPSNIINVLAGGDLQAAINNAVLGTTIQLPAGVTFQGNYTLPPKIGDGVVTITTSMPIPSGRMSISNAAPLAKVRAPSGGGAAIATLPGAHHYTLLGLEIPNNPVGFGDLIQLGDGSTAQNSLTGIPHDLILDRCYIHGDPLIGQKRGISLNSALTTIMECYISDIKTVGQDTQAIAGWNGPGPYNILDCYLEGAGENVLFGGADAAVPNLVPADIILRGCTLNKPLSWRPLTWQIKNLLEFKNARRVLVDTCALSNIWGAAQTGYAIQLTPRNQDGSAPWSTVEDLTIQNCTIQHAAAAINFLGTDNLQTSLRMSRIKILSNTFSDIDPQAYGGSDKTFQMVAGPVDVIIDNNIIIGNNIGSILYFDGTPKALRLAWTNNTYPTSLYGIFGGSSSVGGTPLPHAWTDYVDTGTFSGNVQK